MDANSGKEKHIFVSYCGIDIHLVRKIQKPLEDIGMVVFVASEAIVGGTQTIDGIANGVYNSGKSLLLITPAALKSSWFAFETILSLEWSEQLGRVGVVVLLHGVDKEEMSKYAILNVAPTFTVSFDADGNWNARQVRKVVKAIQKEIKIDMKLPVGNVAHAQAWSHYYGYHDVIQECLRERIMRSKWYRENPANFPIKVYELVPGSCNIQNMEDFVTKVGTLELIRVQRCGNTKRPYALNVYCIEDDGQKYYCVAQYPNVISAIWKMEQSEHIQMSTYEKKMQLYRFYYTLNAILHHRNNPFHNQARLLQYDDTCSNPRDVLLYAIKKDINEHMLVKALPSENSWKQSPAANHPNQKYYEAVIVCGTENEKDRQIACEIEDHLKDKGVRLYANRRGLGAIHGIKEAIRLCQWLVLILTKTSLKEDFFNFNAVSLLGQCVHDGSVNIIPVVDDSTSEKMPSMLGWVTYIDMRTEGYKDRICQAVKGEAIPLVLDSAYLPAGNLGYGLAWGYIVNYMYKVLPEFGPYFENVFRLEKGEFQDCPEKMYLLIPSSCRCPNLIENKHVEHFRSFAELNDNHGGANILKTLDIYTILDDDNIRPKKHHFIGQYAPPVQCLYQMKECGVASINVDKMKQEVERFCHTFTCLMNEKVGQGLQSKCEIVRFNDSNPEDLRRQLIPKLRNDRRRR